MPTALYGDHHVIPNLQDLVEQVHLLTDDKQKLETEQWNNQQKMKV